MGVPDLVLGEAPDGVFRCMPEAPRWAVMKIAVAAKSKDQLTQMAALVKFTQVCVVPADRERLDDYLNEHDDAVERLQEALNAPMMFWSGRPLEQPQTSSTASSPAQESEPTSRVVSLWAGTSETVEPTSQDGQSESVAG